MSKFIRVNRDLADLLLNDCLDTTEVVLNKKIIQNSYATWVRMTGDRTFLNWGLWDKKLYKEYTALNYNFSKISNFPNIYQQLLFYFLLRPLIKIEFFDKRLLDIGCGNGLALKAGSEILHTNYALGIDLVSVLAKQSHGNFYKKNAVNYIQADAERLPLESESFDIVTNLESSHLYPRIENFFGEVERILAPNGYFCYSDFDTPKKSQSLILDQFIKESNNLKIIHKLNITKLVQASIYQRIIATEDEFYKMAVNFLGKDSEELMEEIKTLAFAMGLTFLPWWKIWFKNPERRWLAKAARKDKFWKKKHYFYYLVQKI